MASITTNYKTLDFDRDGEVLRVWLNRPEKLNAIDSAMLREVGDFFGSLEKEHHARVVVLGGRGRSFSAGADRTPAPDPDRPTTPQGQRWYANLGRRACQAIEACAIPTIARVQGHAVGGGMCFAMSCDFRLTSDTATWHLPEVELGLPLTWSAIPRLAQEIGTSRARQLVLMAQPIDGITAVHWAVAHQASPERSLDATVDQWVERLLGLPPLAVHMTKTTFRSLGRAHGLGEVSETDGDLLTAAQRDPEVAARFSGESPGLD